MAVERVLSNLNLVSFKTEGGLQNHIDELQDSDLVFTPDNSLKGNLFDFKWTDHKLNDISWLNADTFSWQSGDVYVAAFEHLVNDYISLPTGVLYAYYAEDAGETFYLRTDTPSVGDQLLDETGTPAYEAYGEHKVKEIYDDGSFARTATFPGNRFYRDTSKDVTLSAPQSETETISGITIRYYKADDGHKICMQDQEANVQALYNATGVAWYYILDIVNKQFKLPRTKYAFTGLRDSVGGYVEAGLPNITGTILSRSLSSDYPGAVTHGTGAFSFSKKTGANSSQITITNTSGAADTISFNASSSSSVYGNSNTVQPEATQMYLYFYVGNFERDAIEQTAGITSEQLNNKADIELFNAIYPVGSIYIGTQSVCPMAIAIPNSTWELLEAGRALWTGNGSNGNTKIAAGLPNITGGGVYAFMGQKSGATKDIPKAVNGLATGSSWVEGVGTGVFDASDSNSVYGNSTTVQPPAYVVNVWRRTA